MHVVVLDRARSRDIEAVLNVVNIVAQERASANNAVGAVRTAADIRDLAILDGRSGDAGLDPDARPIGGRDLAVLNGHVGHHHADGAFHVECIDHGAGRCDVNILRRGQRHAVRNTSAARIWISGQRRRWAYSHIGPHPKPAEPEPKQAALTPRLSGQIWMIRRFASVRFVPA